MGHFLNLSWETDGKQWEREEKWTRENEKNETEEIGKLGWA